MLHFEWISLEEPYRQLFSFKLNYHPGFLKENLYLMFRV